MSNRSYCASNKFSQNYRSGHSINEHNRCKLPAINNGATTIGNMNQLSSKSSLPHPCTPQVNENYSNFKASDCNTGNTNNPSSQVNGAPLGPAVYNARTPSYNNCKTNCSPQGVASSPCNDMQQVPANRGWYSNQYIGADKKNKTNPDGNKNVLINQNMNSPQRSMTSGPGDFNCSPANMNISNGQKTVLRDRHLANEILQKAGISSNLTPNDCLEVITDVPVTMNDNVNCDPNPLCMKKPADCQVILNY